MRRGLVAAGAAVFVVASARAPARDFVRDRDVFVGASRGVYQFAIPANTAQIRATSRVGLFMSTLGLFHAMHTTNEDWHGSEKTAKDIVTAFGNTGPGIIEGNLDRSTTPSVPSQQWNYTRQDDWASWLALIDWKPSIFLLNINAHGTPSTTLYTNADVQDVVTGTKDIERFAPYIKLVLPYLSPNSGVYGSWSRDAYWATARDVASRQGGFAIDIPVGYYLTNNQAYRKVIQDQIRWAVAHRLVVGVLLSPCSTNPHDWTIAHSCSFSADPHFMTSTQNVVSKLEQASADPTIWIITNYSEQSVSPYPGTDDKQSPHYDPNTILAVASWVAEHAKTSPFPRKAKKTGTAD